MSGWFDRHEDKPVPASIDFIFDAGLLTCPTCGSQLDLEGPQLVGKVMFLIGDHTRTHQGPQAAFRWQS